MDASIVSLPSALLLTLLGTLLGVVWFIRSLFATIERELERKADAKATEATFEAKEEAWRRRHHDADTKAAANDARIELELRQLARDAVQRKDFEALDARLTQQIGRLTDKVDRLSELVPLLQAGLLDNKSLLTRLVERGEQNAAARGRAAEPC